MIVCAVAVVIGLSTFALYTTSVHSGIHISERNTIIFSEEENVPTAQDAISSTYGPN